MAQESSTGLVDVGCILEDPIAHRKVTRPPVNIAIGVPCVLDDEALLQSISNRKNELS
jgi:hypothetical protein